MHNLALDTLLFFVLARACVIVVAPRRGSNLCVSVFGFCGSSSPTSICLNVVALAAQHLLDRTHAVQRLLVQA